MRTGLVICLVLAAFAAHGAEVVGVKLPDTIKAADGTTLLLNGAGVRKKFFIKIYVGALYLPAPARTAAAAIGQSGPKRVLMHFVYDGVGAGKITEGWNEGFAANLGADALASLARRLQRFNAMFVDMHRDDTIVLDYAPRDGVKVIINGQARGTIEGDDFMRALLSVWLGDKPADAGLKQAMLGGD